MKHIQRKQGKLVMQQRSKIVRQLLFLWRISFLSTTVFLQKAHGYRIYGSDSETQDFVPYEEGFVGKVCISCSNRVNSCNEIEKNSSRLDEKKNAFVSLNYMNSNSKNLIF